MGRLIGGPRLQPARSAAVALLLYVGLWAGSFYPQSLAPGTTIAYVGDSLETVYIVASNVHRIIHDPLHLFDANILYPLPRAMTFTDHRLLPSLMVAPVIWLTGNAVLAGNVAVMLACILAAFAARRLALTLGLDAVAAWAVGALYGFHTYQVNEAPRLNIVFHGFIVLALRELVLYLRTGERRRAWMTALYMLLQGLSANYHLLYGVLVLGLVTLGALAMRPAPTARRLPALLLAGAVAAAAFLPIAIPYVRTAREQRLVRGLPEGIGCEHYVSTTPTNLLYGAIGTEVRLQQRGPHFIGFVSLALAAATLVAWGRARDAECAGVLIPTGVWVPAAALMALILILLSLGRDITFFGSRLAPGPYRLLYHLPGFQLVRIPERLGLLAMLFIALLAGRGLMLLRGAGWRRMSLLLALAIPVEHLSPLPVTERVRVGRDIPEVYRFLASYPARAIVEIPSRGEGLVRKETIEAYFSTVHWKPIVHGYTAFPPLLTRMLRRAAADLPSEGSLQAMARVGVDTAVAHHGRGGPDLPALLRDAETAGHLRREARFEGPSAHLFESTADEVYRLLPLSPLRAAPWPSGRRAQDPRWSYRAKVGDPRAAADGDMATAWVARGPLRGDEFIEVAFDRPLAVAGVRLPLRHDSVFPTRFRLIGKTEAGWVEVAQLSDAHRLQLIDQLRASAPAPALGFDLGGRVLRALMIQVAQGGESFDGWSMPELEVWCQ